MNAMAVRQVIFEQSMSGKKDEFAGFFLINLAFNFADGGGVSIWLHLEGEIWL